HRRGGDRREHATHRKRRAAAQRRRPRPRLLTMSPLPSPPVAERRPTRRTVHGVELVDDYAWLRDANWQQVMRDPSVLSPDIRAYLEAENSYCAAALKDTAVLRDRLFAEMKGRIKEHDDS